jgi:hypothetical protein
LKGFAVHQALLAEAKGNLSFASEFSCRTKVCFGNARNGRGNCRRLEGVSV